MGAPGEGQTPGSSERSWGSEFPTWVTTWELMARARLRPSCPLTCGSRSVTDAAVAQVVPGCPWRKSLYVQPQLWGVPRAEPRSGASETPRLDQQPRQEPAPRPAHPVPPSPPPPIAPTLESCVPGRRVRGGPSPPSLSAVPGCVRHGELRGLLSPSSRSLPGATEDGAVRPRPRLRSRSRFPLTWWSGSESDSG